ncbi:MAG: alpha/beta hydrolase, partial [Micromonosporaceae bacterium]|nr:alpha/beta hydrolase [Micromonosporaceae bacterium]
MARRTAALLAGFTVALTLAAGCSPNLRWVSPTSGAAPSAPSASGPSVGTVAWQDCTDTASGILPRLAPNTEYDCGSIQVPQDWKAPQNGDKFDIALMRVRNRNQTDRIGSLIVNPGGPGGSGIEIAAYLSLELPGDILNRFDVVGFDPRGVGRSSPAIKCFANSDMDKAFGLDPDPVKMADFNTLASLWQKMGNDCQQKYGAELPLFSTEQSARDMDAIRAAVGDQKISYLGFSYGTLLGAVYAQLFPKNIRALVLDGAVDPTLAPVDAAEGQAQGFEHAFDEFAAWCKQNTASCPIAPNARAAVNAAMQQARTAPVANSDGRKATAGWVLTGITEALYSQQLWPVMATAVAALRRGNAKAIMELADEYAQRGPNGQYGNMFDAFDTISCDDDASGETVALARQKQLDWRAKYPLFGGSLGTGILSCAAWPAKRDPFPTGKAKGAPPMVVVGTINDPATPYTNTARLANMLGNSTVVTWQGEGHTAYPQTSCIRATIDAYLI